MDILVLCFLLDTCYVFRSLLPHFKVLLNIFTIIVFWECNWCIIVTSVFRRFWFNKLLLEEPFWGTVSLFQNWQCISRLFILTCTVVVYKAFETAKVFLSSSMFLPWSNNGVSGFAVMRKAKREFLEKRAYKLQYEKCLHSKVRKTL